MNFCKYLRDRVLRENVGAQNLVDFGDRIRHFKQFFKNGQKEIETDSDPDLSLDGVAGIAEEMFNAEVLFDPFEESFDSPTVFINQRDGFCWKIKIIGKKNEKAVLLFVKDSDAPKAVWEV